MAACDAEMALLVVPLMVAFIVPSTVKSPEISAELDTESEPVICASNIFIYVVLYINKYLTFGNGSCYVLIKLNLNQKMLIGIRNVGITYNP